MKHKIPEWKSDIANDVTFSGDAAKLTIQQGESLLKDTTDTAKQITDKAEKIITVLIPIATAIVVYLFNQITRFWASYLPGTALFALLVILASLFFAYKNFEKYEISPLANIRKIWLIRSLLIQTSTRTISIPISLFLFAKTFNGEFHLMSTKMRSE